MDNPDLKNYLKAISSKKSPEIKLASSKRSQAMKSQDKKCARCKKDLRPYLMKNITNPKTKDVEIICADCAIPTRKRN